MLHSEPDWPKTLEEFRAWHERQPDVWEFIDGVPKLMAPGSMAHTLIKSNTHAVLARAVQGTGCRALVDGAIIEVEGSSLIPDVAVTCSELDFTTPGSTIRSSSSRCFPPRTRRTTSAASSRSTSESHRCAITS